MTRDQAKQMGAQFSAALALETNEEVIANGKPLVNLFAEAVRTEDDEERAEILNRTLAYNLRMFERARARVHTTRKDEKCR